MSLPKTISLSALLEKRSIATSAPCRIELGGTWDVKGFALPYEWINPCTVNIAMNMRTHVILSSHTPGKIKLIQSNESIEFDLYTPDLKGPFKLLCMIASYFGMDGYVANFAFESPVKSGLGGSGVVAIVFIAALQRARQLLNNTKHTFSKNEQVYLAHCFEESLNFSITGIQDQAAAMFGGVNYWEWHYSKPVKFTRKSILEKHQYKELEKRLIIVYLGPHNSSDMNKKYVDSFFNSAERVKWFELNQKTKEFSQAITSQNWEKIIKIMKYENNFRQQIAPERLIPVGHRLWKIAQKNAAGFSVCGAGAGGCIWTIAKTEEIKQIIEQEYAAAIGKENILSSQIAFEGLKYTYEILSR
ncbi:MAG: hypothetical protein M3Q44_06860 [bacterium]|nr:hypothetical protein [bacterium]